MRWYPMTARAAKWMDNSGRHSTRLTQLRGFLNDVLDEIQDNEGLPATLDANGQKVWADDARNQAKVAQRIAQDIQLRIAFVETRNKGLKL